MKITNTKIVSSVGWKFIERFGIQAGTFFLTLFLARLLSPQDYGIIALLLVFTSISATFVQAGFNTALIQKKEATSDDFKSVMIFSLVVASLLYFVLYMIAPIVSKFYNMPLLTKYLRVLGLILFPGAFNSVQIAFVTKNLHFKLLTIANFIAIIFSFVGGITLAYLNFGVWALIAQHLLMQTSICVFLFILVKWNPFAGDFSLTRLKTLFSFGINVLCSNLLVALFLDLRTILIGKFYQASDLGFFNRGKHFPQAVMESINGTIQSVLLPIYSTEQENPEQLLFMLRRTIRLSSFMLFPLLLGLICVAKPLVIITLTEKWLLCVPFLQIFALSAITHPFQLITAQAMNAKGRPDVLLRIEIIRKISEIGLLLLALPMSVTLVAWSALVAGIIGIIATIYPNCKILKYSLLDQIKDVFPALIISAVMALITWSITYISISVYLLLPLQIIIGCLIYLILAYLFNMQAMQDLIKIWKIIKDK